MMGPSLLARAAAAGDSHAAALAAVRGHRQEAEAELLTPADAGDPDAMFALGLLGLRGHELWEFLGSDAKISAAERADIANSVRWLRAAAEGGRAPAMARLATLPALSESERLTWLHKAALGGAWRAASRYADWLSRQGREDEAGRWYLIDVEAGSADAASRLAQIHEEAGETAEADEFRRTATELERPLFSGVAMADIAPIVIAAAATTAVVPFVQTIASKLAEDAYSQARGLIARLFARNSRPGPYDMTPHRLLVVEDDEQPLEVFLWADVSDDALRGLGALDVAELMASRPKEGRIRLVWNAADSAWLASTDEAD